MAFLDSSGVTRLWQHIIAKLGNKVDKEIGKGLSTNDYTTTEKNKLAGIDTAAYHPESYFVPATRTINNKALSANISLTASDVGAAASSHTHSYLPLTGGTLTGYLTLQNNDTYPRLFFKSSSYNDPQGEMYYRILNNEASSSFLFRQYCRSSKDYSLLSTYEEFRLPQTTADRTSIGYYNILTTKSAVTVAQGGTGATSATRALANLGAASSTLIRGQMKTFTIEGDKDHYYPVVFNVNSEYFVNRIAITRYYNDTAPNDWGTDTNHKGGLTFQFQWNGDNYWGGNGTSTSLKVETLIENYCKIIEEMKLSTFGVVVWLRDGSASYKVLNEMGSAISITPYYNTFTDDAENSFPVRTYDASVVDNEIQQRLVFYPLTDSNLLGNLYASGEICSKKNNYPEVYFKNTARTALANFYVDTTSGGFADIKLKVFSSASIVRYFTFGKDGTFTAPFAIQAERTYVRTNNYPEHIFQNANGVMLAELYANTATGAYSSVHLRVYSSATDYSTFNFGNDGKLSCGSLALATALPISSGGTGSTTASGALANLGALPLTGGTLTGNLSVNGIITAKTYLAVERNSNPQLALKNANSNPLAVLYTETSDGSYGNTHLQVYKSATESTTFTFGNTGNFRAYGNIYGSTLQVDGANNWPSLWFKCSSKTNPGVLLQTNELHSFGIYCYGSDLDTATTRYFEGYTFPAPATGLTANKTYTVYSEKNIIYSSSQPTGVKGAIWLKPV